MQAFQTLLVYNEHLGLPSLLSIICELHLDILYFAIVKRVKEMVSTSKDEGIKYWLE